MSDTLAQSGNLIPYCQDISKIGRMQDSSQDGLGFGDSLQVVNPEITIQDLLVSLDSNKGNREYKEVCQGYQYGSGRPAMRKCQNRYTEINFTIEPDQHSDEQLLALVAENNQLESTIESILEQLSRETELSEQLMERVVANNVMLAKQKCECYRGWQDSVGRERVVESKPKSVQLYNNSTSYTDSLAGYKLEYPVSSFNPYSKPHPPTPQPESQLQQQLAVFTTSTNGNPNRSMTTTDSLEQLFRNLEPLSANVSHHCHQNVAGGSAVKNLYRKVVPTVDWGEAATHSQNFVEENKEKLRRRLSERQGYQGKQPGQANQTMQKKQTKIQYKYSTPIKNQNSNPSPQQPYTRKTIFNTNPAPPPKHNPKDPNSGRNRISTVKIDVRAIK